MFTNEAGVRPPAPTSGGAPHAQPPFLVHLTPQPTTRFAGTRLGGEGAIGSRSDSLGLSGRFVFLFVGGTLHRKGIDILLEAYQRAFSAYDDVCLVIKDTGIQMVYKRQKKRERSLALAVDPSRPAVNYLEEDMPAWQLAGLSGNRVTRWAVGRTAEQARLLETGDLSLILGGLPLGKERCASLAVLSLRKALEIV